MPPMPPMPPIPPPPGAGAGPSSFGRSTISASTSRDTGIPQGMAYLIGFVEHANIEADAATE